MDHLAGKVAIVTGAARGLGRAFADALIARGCSVVVTDRDAAILDVAREIGATGHLGDVADPDHVRAVVDATVNESGRIDVLVNNAGEVMPSGPRDDWDAPPPTSTGCSGRTPKGRSCSVERSRRS